MRTLKASALVILVLAFTATAAFAGGSACCASKQVKSASADGAACLSTAFAGAGNHCSSSQAKLAELVDIEATRLPSGNLIVMYKGKTPDAIAYLQAAAAGTADNFCCPLTRQLASKPNAKVEIAKITTGAVIVVSSTEKSLVDEYEHSYLTLASAAK